VEQAKAEDRERTTTTSSSSTTHTTAATENDNDEIIMNGSSVSGSINSNNSTGYYQTANNSNCNQGAGQMQTIEDQIKHVDRIIKDCDVSRKNLEHIHRRLDDLNDEVRR
jgi:hypothetical protein